jgi:hypothetical protein
MSVCVALNASTTGWVPRSEDQNVITVGPPSDGGGAAPEHADSVSTAALTAQASRRDRWGMDVPLVVERALSHTISERRIRVKVERSK